MMETKHMSRPKDQVRAAYYDELGTAFGKKVRSRVHWIIRETKGDQILDIGCSGGLVPILLGREGKQVFGIDVSPEAIEEAKKRIEWRSRFRTRIGPFGRSQFNDVFDATTV